MNTYVQIKTIPCTHFMNFVYWQATIAEREGELACLQSALSDAEIDRQSISKKLAKVKEEYKLLDQKCLSVLAVNENLQSEVSQIECLQNQVSLVKQEALRWKNELEIKNAELTQLKGSTQEVAKLKEDNESLRKENAELKGEVEAQRVQVSYRYCYID